MYAFSLRICTQCTAEVHHYGDRCRECGNALSSALSRLSWWRWLVGVDGRVNRKGFLVRELIAFGLLVLATVLLSSWPVGSDGTVESNVFRVLYFGLVLSSIAIHISSLVRRFHDRGHDGSWVLLLFVPILGFVLYFTLLLGTSDLTTNEHGGCPAGLNLALSPKSLA
jgi:uncharacterized membrane protein YhaH (DUF805 family)